MYSATGKSPGFVTARRRNNFLFRFFFHFFFFQTTTDLQKKLAKANIQILTTETFADDPTVQVKSLKVSRHSTCSWNFLHLKHCLCAFLRTQLQLVSCLSVWEGSLRTDPRLGLQTRAATTLGAKRASPHGRIKSPNVSLLRGYWEAGKRIHAPAEQPKQNAWRESETN